MILLDTSAADAVHVMERARSEIERHTHEEMPHCRLTASFGIAGLRESDLIFDTLIRRADRALYRSKLARSEEHTSELQSLMRISYAVFCLKKKIKRHIYHFMCYIQYNQIP